MRRQFTNSTEFPPDLYSGPPNGSNTAKLPFSNARTVSRLRMLWDQRLFLLCLTCLGLLLGTAIAFLIPKRYESTTRLMPPDQSSSGMAMLSAAFGGRSGGAGAGSGSGSGGIRAVAGDLLGMKTSTGLFIGILPRRTVEDDLINKFDLSK